MAGHGRCLRTLPGILAATALVAACDGPRANSAAPPLEPIAWTVTDSLPSSAPFRMLQGALTRSAFEGEVISFATIPLNGDTLVAGRVRVGSGTGWNRTDFVLVADGHIVWHGLASEVYLHSVPGAPPSYRITACLSSDGESALGYTVRPDNATAQAMVRADSAPPAGRYRWLGRELRHVASPTSAAEATCEAESPAAAATPEG